MPPIRSDGWKYGPIRIIFDVKHDGRHQTRIVIGGHVTDATGNDTYAATVRTENVCLMFYLAVLNNDGIISGDISTAYLNELTKEMIWTRAGPEFGPYEGMIIIMYKALYGAKGSANAWYLCFADSNRQDGFNLSRIDSLFWYRLDRGSDRYDYLCHFVDDFLNAGPEAQGVVDGIKAKYTVTGDEDIPVYYLGMDITVNETRTGFILSTRKYMTKCIPQIEALIGRKLGKASTPTIYDWRPAEYDESPLLSPSDVHVYQQIVGKGIWLVTCGRVDIMYAGMTLTRF